MPSSIVTEETTATDSQGRKPRVQQEQTDGSIILQTSPVVSLPEKDADPKNFWEKAWNALREQQPSVVDAYEKDLLASEDLYQHGTFFVRNRSQVESKIAHLNVVIDVQGEKRQELLKNRLDQKLKAMQATQLKITVGGKDVVIKEQVRKVVHAILCAKDYIGVAISAEPHAALAWAGVLFVLPVMTYLQNEYIFFSFFNNIFGTNITPR